MMPVENVRASIRTRCCRSVGRRRITPRWCWTAATGASSARHGGVTRPPYAHRVTVLHPGVGVPSGATYLPSTVDHLRWGRLPCEADDPVLSVDPGTEVVVDTI